MSRRYDTESLLPILSIAYRIFQFKPSHNLFKILSLLISYNIQMRAHDGLLQYK